jgi:hypothetical protein
VRARIEALIRAGEDIPPRPEGQRLTSRYEVRRSIRYEVRPYTTWRGRAISLLAGALPPTHTYVVEFTNRTEYDPQEGPLDRNIESGLGILNALADDLEHGYLVGLRTLISGEIFTDFIEMAEHLLAEGYSHAAASIAGAVLEDSLRRTLAERSAKATGNLESMNQIGLDTGLYGRPVYLQVKLWIDLRNDADHGKWKEVDRGRVEPRSETYHPSWPHSSAWLSRAWLSPRRTAKNGDA